MPRSNAVATASGMLSDLKSRLGFSGRDEADAGGDFGEYDDFDNDGFSPKNDIEYAGYGADYDENAPAGGYQPLSTRSTGKYGNSSPDLVSIDDVRARTRAGEASRVSGDAAATSGRTRRASGRELISGDGPAQSSPAYNAQVRERENRSRSEGLDSLFEPTGASSGAAGSRKLTIVSPRTYEDAEQVANALKAGDAVVLSMKLTGDALRKRILDFSFGAAAVLGASVDSPADKVFVIASGYGLTEVEKLNLRTQGVL